MIALTAPQVLAPVATVGIHGPDKAPVQISAQAETGLSPGFLIIEHPVLGKIAIYADGEIKIESGSITSVDYRLSGPGSVAATRSQNRVEVRLIQGSY